MLDCSHKTKVLMLTWEFPPNIIGGLARHVHGLSDALSEQGFEIHIITTLKDGLVPYEKVNDLHIHRVKPYHEVDHDFITWIAGLNLAMIEKAKVLALNYEFEVIHAHDWLVGAAGMTLKEGMAIPLITTIHATESGRNNGIYTDMQKFIHEKERLLIHTSNHIIVCSDYMIEEIQNLFVLEDDKMSMIPNGIEEPYGFIPEGILHKLPIDSSKKMIFSIGRMVKEKGFDTLIDAALVLKEIDPEVYFVIAGKGPMLDEYRRKVEELKLESTVIFVGFISDEERNAFFAECEFTVFPSRYEPFGIVALESLIFGKPTIVSNVGGLKGIIEHMRTGLLMEPGVPSSFVEQASILLNDESLSKTIGLAGKKLVKDMYSWNHIASETKHVYGKVLKNFRENMLRSF